MSDDPHCGEIAQDIAKPARTWPRFTAERMSISRRGAFAMLAAGAGAVAAPVAGAAAGKPQGGLGHGGRGRLLANIGDAGGNHGDSGP